jgi:tRNA(Leu) C34 or U34 (ribose-2'-O)-methylase TrmL
MLRRGKGREKPARRLSLGNHAARLHNTRTRTRTRCNAQQNLRVWPWLKTTPQHTAGEFGHHAGEGGREMRGYAAVGLDNPKTDSNIASALRACAAFDAKMLAVSGRRYKRNPVDTTVAWRHLPLLATDDLHKVIPYDCVPVAIELLRDGIPLQEYKHPERAFYVFGAEDATLGERVLSWCRDVVFIPTRYCMNLAATVNVVLYDRTAKELTK